MDGAFDANLIWRIKEEMS